MKLEDKYAHAYSHFGFLIATYAWGIVTPSIRVLLNIDTELESRYGGFGTKSASVG